VEEEQPGPRHHQIGLCFEESEEAEQNMGANMGFLEFSRRGCRIKKRRREPRGGLYIPQAHGRSSSRMMERRNVSFSNMWWLGQHFRTAIIHSSIFFWFFAS